MYFCIRPVVAPMVRSWPRASWFQQVGGIAGAPLAAGTDQRVDFVDEQHNRRRAGLHFINQRLQALQIRLSCRHRPAACHPAAIGCASGAGTSRSGSFDHCGFANTRFGPAAVLPAANIIHLADLITAGDRIDASFARALRILRVLRQRAGGCRCGTLGARLCHQRLLCLFAAGEQRVELLQQRISIDTANWPEMPSARAGEVEGFEHANQQMAAANARRTVLQRGGVDPGARRRCRCVRRDRKPRSHRAAGGRRRDPRQPVSSSEKWHHPL